MRISLTIAALIASNDAVEVTRIWDTYGTHWDSNDRGLYNMDAAVSPLSYSGQNELGNEFFSHFGSMNTIRAES